MPLCARLASPGRGVPEPPPIRPASEMVWWGERKGRSWSRPAPARRMPATLWILVVSMASSKAERRQDAGQPLGEHGLAGTGRADHEDVVGSGGGHFERTLGHGLAADFAEVGRRGRIGMVAVARGRGRGELVGTVDQRDRLGQVAHAVDPDALDDRRFGCILRGHDQVGDALAARADGDREGAAHGSYGAIERELAGGEILVLPAGDAHGAEDA